MNSHQTKKVNYQRVLVLQAETAKIDLDQVTKGRSWNHVTLFAKSRRRGQAENHKTLLCKSGRRGQAKNHKTLLCKKGKEIIKKPDDDQRQSTKLLGTGQT